jgi:hypothetical protein
MEFDDGIQHVYNSIPLLRTLALKSLWHHTKINKSETFKNNIHVCASFTITEVWLWKVPIYNLTVNNVNLNLDYVSSQLYITTTMYIT